MSLTEAPVDILFEWKKDVLSSIKPSFEKMANGLLSTEFVVNMSTGKLEYDSDVCNFYVNEETGNLEWGEGGP